MGKYFGTDGIRGVAGEDLSYELALKVGRAGAEVLLNSPNKGKVVIGKDTRLSGDMLEEALIIGISEAGAQVLRAGVTTTPAISYLTPALRADFGVVISASHNPAAYNGIKFFGPSGMKIEDELEERIEAILDSKKPANDEGAQIGRCIDLNEANERYIEHALNGIKPASGLKVVLDCANGAAYEIAPTAFKRLKVEFSTIGDQPDGGNINLSCGSTHPDSLKEAVIRAGADVGFAYDGDADRVIAVDELGNVIDGDFIMAILASHLKEKGLLKGSTVVTTVMTNLGFDLAMKEWGIEVIKTDVGDKWVLREMIKRGAIIGGEQSGHIILLENNPTGDGLITSLNLLKVMAESGKKLSELAKIMTRLPQTLINVRVKSKDGWEERASIKKVIAEAEKDLGSIGRILVRPSGTEPLIRVMVESDDEEHAKEVAEVVAGVIERELG